MTDNPGLNPHERIDELGRKGFRIIQNTKTFCFGIDAVLLADFASVSRDEKVADLGCGNGILPLLLAGRDKGRLFYAFEIQPEAADLARRNMILNRLEERVRIFQEDLKRAPEILGKGSMDAVVCNPPYYKLGAGILNPESAKAIARHELFCTLSDIMNVSAALLKPGGSLFLVHRSSRLTELLREAESRGLFLKQLRMVHSYAESEAALLLCEFIRGRAPECRILPPLILYEEKGRFTQEVHKMYYGEER